MQQQNFKRNLIAASVAMTLGISGTTFAAQTEQISPDSNPSISNKASATYSVDGQEQTPVESNEVTVTIKPVAQFSLVGVQGALEDDDMNENQPATPGGTTTFVNKLTNEGNESDTYTLTIDPNGNDDNIDTADPDYQFTNVTDMTVKIYSKDGTLQDTKTVKNGETVTLEAGEYAEISYTATTPDNVKGGDDATLTLSATSEDITNLDSTKATLVNESQAEVKLPVFSIIKTASVTKINLNDPNPTFEYTIEVTNDRRATYTTDAINALIQDTLPEGISVNGEASAITVDGGVGATNNGNIQLSTKGNRQVVSLQGVNIAVGQTITITIPVKVTDKETLKAAGSATNNADVYDNYNDDPVDPNNPDDADIHDSTDGSTDSPNTPDKDDGDNPDKPGGDKPGPKVDFTDRSLTLEDQGAKELPPTTTPNGENAKYEHTIVNNGNQDEAGVKVEITDPDGNTVDVTNVKYTPENGDEVPLTKGKDGKYELPTIPKDGGKGKITYEVVTDGAKPGDYPTTVTVTPATEEGDDAAPAPSVPSKTDTTTVKKLDLVKEQAIDPNCDGNLAGQFTQDTLNNAKPGQCIVYKITANNPFTSKAFKDVIITDAATKWNTGATYKTNSVSVSTDAQGTVEEVPSNNAGNVKAKFATIPAGKNGWVKFTVQINP